MSLGFSSNDIDNLDIYELSVYSKIIPLMEQEKFDKEINVIKRAISELL